MNKVLPLVMTTVLSSLINAPINNKEVDKPQARPDISIVGPDPSLSYSSSSSSSSSSIPQGDEFYSNRYGPFYSSSLQDVDVTFYYNLKSISSQSIIERIRLLNSSNNVVSTSSKASRYYFAGQTVSVSFTLPLRNYLTSSGLTLYFEILNSSTYSVLKRYAATFYPVANESVPYNTLKNDLYTSKSFGFYGDGNGLVNTRETFDFRPTGDYLNIDYYYELDLTKNIFKYLNTYSLTYQSITLRFNDSENLFPHFTHQSNGDISIALSLYKNGESVNFTFKNRFYVNKKTLDISDSYRANYAVSNRFYLPINGRNKFNNKILYIDVVGLGTSALSTTIALRYNTNRNLVGVCTDGDNCVVGGNG